MCPKSVDHYSDAVLFKPYNEKEIFTTMEEHLNLHYVYEKDSELPSQEATLTLNGKDLLGLPETWLDDFLDSARLGDIDAKLTLTNTLNAVHVETQTKLNNYINNFQMEPLIKIIREIKGYSEET